MKKLTHDYGFLQSLSSSETVYFNTAHVVQTREGERLRVGSQVIRGICRLSRLYLTFALFSCVICWKRSMYFAEQFSRLPGFSPEHFSRVQVETSVLTFHLPVFARRQAEFWVVPDRIKNRDSFRALEVQILPPGTLTLEEETHKKLQGTVERAPTLPQRQGFREGALRFSCSKAFSFTLRFLVPSRVARCVVHPVLCAGCSVSLRHAVPHHVRSVEKLPELLQSHGLAPAFKACVVDARRYTSILPLILSLICWIYHLQPFVVPCSAV